ncbi:MAG: uncharacterized protein A8A55_2619 [Amphiamblys sp. WSBS2006]|nr:MAG: uncharacterized protein A8A55_2619 [Amphiamblys sp. WSBS2006]
MAQDKYRKAETSQRKCNTGRAKQALKRKLRAAATITVAPERCIDRLHGSTSGYSRSVHRTTGAKPLNCVGIPESLSGPEEESVLDEEEDEERQRDMETEEGPLCLFDMRCVGPRKRKQSESI